MINNSAKPHQQALFKNGIGLYYGFNSPEHFPEHSHAEIQIITTFENASCLARWHSPTGQSISRHVHAGHTCVTAREQPHGSDWLATAAMVIFYLSPEFVEQAAFDTVRRSEIKIIGNHLTEDVFIQSIARAVRNEHRINGDIASFYTESLASVLTAHLIRQYDERGNIFKDTVAKLSPQIIRRAMEYLHDQIEFSEKFSLAEMSRSVGMSPYHFARSFKTTIGFSPYQYLLKRRVEMAKELLTDPNLKISEIALRVGCASASHFSTLFKRLVGKTPNEYRK